MNGPGSPHGDEACTLRAAHASHRLREPLRDSQALPVHTTVTGGKYGTDARGRLGCGGPPFHTERRLACKASALPKPCSDPAVKGVPSPATASTM
eukprot:CAMPEP_0183369252 /NCGR_PEP_ID=MMETSP0164_2-20130417/98697_1 /TAXON_ID=221442 /ORGANISM="Coccolithus pelagicus ssp braarudi, Strain PLY182g" /LENGTH=94 /DNA_ID=CAMNT_0025545481 /DNA_START=441 /DNA_END=726 /DNA_ORIENTATION=-